MEIIGKLVIEIAGENRAGQSSLSVAFVAEEGVKLKLNGLRVHKEAVLPALSVMSNGHIAQVTVLSPGLQEMILRWFRGL